MLIFWRAVSDDDLDFFNNGNLSRVSYNITKTDRAVNIGLGFYFLFLFISSLFLNPWLFWFFSLKKSKSNILFRHLAAFDFITNFFTPLVYTIVMWSPKLIGISNIVLVLTRTWCCLVGCFSQITTCLLAFTRFFKVLLPFVPIRFHLVLAYLWFYIGYMTLNNGGYFIIETFFRHYDYLIKLGLNLCVNANLLHSFLGVFVSIITVVYLLAKGKSSEIKDGMMLKSSLTILYMNIPYIITVVSGILVWYFLKTIISFHEILFAWIPMTTSGLNPIIILSRKMEARRKIQQKMKQLWGKYGWGSDAPASQDIVFSNDVTSTDKRCTSPSSCNTNLTV